MTRGWQVSIFLLLVMQETVALEPPIAIERLRDCAFDSSLRIEQAWQRSDAFESTVLAYDSTGLTVRALLARPLEPAPADGFPLVIANHGTAPDPPRYGFTADGENSRPGDYYRQIPALFAQRGFLVLMPDFRGHNTSEGHGYANAPLAPAYFAQDVLSLMSAIDPLDGVDTRNVFLWGHSMGGEVTLRVLLATDRARAASLWSPVAGGLLEKAFHYSIDTLPATQPDSLEVPKSELERLRETFAGFGNDFDWHEHEPLRHLDRLDTPVIIHHAKDDPSVPFQWAQELAQALFLRGKSYLFYRYDSDEHLFSGDDLRLAIERDVAFFRANMAPVLIDDPQARGTEWRSKTGQLLTSKLPGSDASVAVRHKVPTAKRERAPVSIQSENSVETETKAGCADVAARQDPAVP